MLSRFISDKTRFRLEMAIVLYLFLSFIPPMSFWFEMKSIETNKTVYEQGENISTD